MADIIKHIRYKDTFVTGKGHRLRHIGLIDIIDRPPGRVHPVCSRLQDVMLEVVLMEKQQTFLRPFLGKLLQAAPVPCIGTVQIILAQSFPGSAFPATGKRLFIERPPCISVTTAYTLMVIPAAFVPQTVIMIQYQQPVLYHIIDCRVNPVRQAQSFASRNKTGDMRFRFSEVAGSQLAIPPGDFLPSAYQQPAVHLHPSIHNGKQMLLFFLLYRCLKLQVLHRFQFSGRHTGGIRRILNPFPHGQARSIRLFRHLHSRLYGRTAGCIRSHGQNTCPGGTVLIQARCQLCIKQATGMHMII